MDSEGISVCACFFLFMYYIWWICRHYEPPRLRRRRREKLHNRRRYMGEEVITAILCKLPPTTLQKFRSVSKSWNSLIEEQKDLTFVHKDLTFVHKDPTFRPPSMEKEEDDVFYQILLRLPAEDLQRFRCVCKSWNTLIQKDLYFGINHFHTPSNLKPPRNFVALSWRTIGDGKACIVGSCFRPDSLQYMTNSCHGLVGIYDRDSFYLSNPSIRKLSELPSYATPPYKFSGMPRAAIGFDPSREEYKVVRMFERMNKEAKLLGYGCEVLSLNPAGATTWRLLNDLPQLFLHLRCKRDCVPVVANGAIYWTLEVPRRVTWNVDHFHEIALSFNLSQENFSFVMHPDRKRSWSGGSASFLFGLGGHVAIAYEISKYKTSIWTLEDHDNSIWRYLFNIDMTKMYYPLSAKQIRLMTMDDDLRIIIYEVWCGRREYYDPLTKKFVEYEDFSEDCDQYHATFKDSVVWPWLP